MAHWKLKTTIKQMPAVLNTCLRSLTVHTVGCRGVLAGKMLASPMEWERLLKQIHVGWWTQEWTGNDTALLLKDITVKKNQYRKTRKYRKCRKTGIGFLINSFHHLFPYNIFCFYNIQSMNIIHFYHKYSLLSKNYEWWLLLWKKYSSQKRKKKVIVSRTPSHSSGVISIKVWCVSFQIF